MIHYTTYILSLDRPRSFKVIHFYKYQQAFPPILFPHDVYFKKIKVCYK